MKVNIVSNNSIVRPIPGTKFTTPVYGKDISDVQIIRLLNFPTLRIYDNATGVAVTKRNVNALLNKKDHAIAEVKEVEHVTVKKKDKKDKTVAKKDIVVETTVVSDPVAVDTEEVFTKTAEEKVTVDTETPIEVVDETTVDAEEVTAINEDTNETDPSEVIDEVPTEQKPVVNKPQYNNNNRKKNKNNRG